MHGLRDKKGWDKEWEKSKLPQTLNAKSMFTFHFDKLMQKHLEKNKKNTKLLEIGCAGGQFLIYFNHTFGYDVYGVDYSAIGCKLAEKSLELTETNGTIICDDIFKCEKLEKESFDVVFSGGFIEHFDQTETVLEKHVDLLKPGGALIIEVPNMLGLHGYVYKIFNQDSYYEHKLLTAKMIEECFTNLGIEIKESRYIAWLILESHGKPRWIQPFFLLVDRILYLVLRLFNSFFESERMSSYIVVIGEKPLR